MPRDRKGVEEKKQAEEGGEARGPPPRRGSHRLPHSTIQIQWLRNEWILQGSHSRNRSARATSAPQWRWRKGGGGRRKVKRRRRREKDKEEEVGEGYRGGERRRTGR